MYSVEWSEVVVERSPSVRGGHSTVVCEGDHLVVFGGQSYWNDGKFKYYNDVYVLDISARIWHKVKTKGETPSARYGHSAHVVGSRMFIFGGKSEEGLSRDMAFLDLIEWCWIPLSVSSASPCPRFFHASVLVGRKIVVHGGWDTNKCFDDLWVFSTDDHLWIQPNISGLPPSPRYSHSLNLLPDGRILCFGGTSFSSEAGSIPIYENDLRQLDTETLTWSKPQIQGNPIPSGRQGHAVAQVEEGLLLFGGWGLAGNQNDTLKQRGSGSCFLLSLGASQQYLTGQAPGKHSVLTWQKLDSDETSFRPHGRSRITSSQQHDDDTIPIVHKYGHTMTTATGYSLYVFGGWTGKQACNSLIRISLRPPFS